MEYKHFNHPHGLRIYEVRQGDQIRCSGCESFCSTGSVYVCWQCKFFLHEKCGNANRAMEHPSHPMHPLTLLPYPTYSAGGFLCKACGATGGAFTYCCAFCDFDLHIQCASLPQIVKNEAHQHNLNLTYALPQDEASSHQCDICHKTLDHKVWTYNCLDCEFRAHTTCATMETGPAAQSEPSGTTQVQPEPTQSEDPVLKAQRELLNLQLQMQMSEQLAQMMASFNLSSFV